MGGHVTGHVVVRVQLLLGVAAGRPQGGTQQGQGEEVAAEQEREGTLLEAALNVQAC